MATTKSRKSRGGTSSAAITDMMAFDDMSPGVLVGMGVLLALAGVFLVISPVFGSIAVTLTVGWVLAVVGVIGIFGAIVNGRPGTDWGRLALSVLSTVAGVLLITDPFVGTFSLTSLLIAWLIVDGIAMTAYAVARRSAGWMWMAATGVIAFALGVMLWIALPLSATWALGTFAGVSLLMRGVAWAATGFELRRVMPGAKASATARRSARTTRRAA